MGKCLNTVSSVALNLTLSLPLFAQRQMGILIQGKTVTAEISAGEKHLYQITLEKDRFAHLNILQKGVDVKVVTYDANGKIAGDFDSPNYTSGPESAALYSSGKGIYILEIQAQSTDREHASYELTLDRVSPKAVQPEGKIDELMAAFDSNQSPGASVAVVSGGRLLFEKGYGMANLEHGIPLRATTPLHVASVTKSFTNYCIFLLEKQGKLKLDDDIRKYVPEVPDFGYKISLRHLAEHSSGMRDYAALRGMARYEIDTREMFFKMLARQHDLNFIPGENCDYSNTGCVLLAEVIQRVSGKSYSRFVKENIFDPLGMNASTVQDDQSMILPGVADSYDRTVDGPKKMYVLGSLVGGTGIISNARDMAIWANHLLHPKDDADIVAKMSTPGKLNDGTRTTFGPGLMVSDHKGHLEIGHSGATGGFKAHVGIFPDDDLAVIVLANTNDIYSRPVARQIAELYFNAPPKRTRQALVSVVPANAVEDPKPAWDKSTLKLVEYTGKYYSDEAATTYSFELIGGQLVIRPGYLSDMTLTPQSRDTFQGAFGGIVEFVRAHDGKVLGCKFTFPRMKNLFFKKLAGGS
ncbi:beta-lactamase family protein [Parapedobacter sp. ISTM3]|uniref:serine hydrolase domain-containing protein n=1 Tax=Parapedobacter sp. ISTM3 TaxID=2800130 RepID=UPI0019055772|nr:serine hydrolase domain-containing protein [Parapedobacter sp. ISTM3]MBK1439420.1 beta-lactamase family protein [Parapedobacter sp. ISTM3]